MTDPRETWFTTAAALQAGEPEWQALAAYRQPILRLARRVAPGLSLEETEDLAHDVLIELRAGAVARYSAQRGRFRDYLAGIVRHQVLAELRRRGRRAQSLEHALEGAPADVWRAFDAEAWLLTGLARFQREVLSQAQGPEILYCFSHRVVRGLGYREIAAREGLSAGAVSRRLAAARDGLLAAFLDLELEELGLAPSARERGKLARALRTSLARQRPVEESLGSKLAVYQPALEAVVLQVRAALQLLPDLEAGPGREFLDALGEVLRA